VNGNLHSEAEFKAFDAFMQDYANSMSLPVRIRLPSSVLPSVSWYDKYVSAS